jgi:hypothetical protein
MYANLRPSPFKDIDRSGVVLPFGVVNAHFDIANPTIAEGLQTDFANPLCGWEQVGV